MHAMALNAMIQAWSEGVILSCRTEGRIYMSYSKHFPPSDRLFKLLKYYQPEIVRALPKEIVT